MSGMAFLGLDAAYRQHRLTGYADHIGTQGEGAEGRRREAQLGAADEDDLLMQARLSHQRVHAGESDLEGQGDMVTEASGAAPVPPSPPSRVMKSTPRPVSRIRLAKVSQKSSSPTADLMPTGSPVSAASSSRCKLCPDRRMPCESWG